MSYPERTRRPFERQAQPSKRPQQVGEVIQMRVAELLKRDVRDPRLSQIVITHVNMSPDLKQAKIFFTQLETTTLPDTEKAFEKANGFLRARLAECLTQRQVPKLVFLYDGNIAYSEAIMKVIDVAVSRTAKDDLATDLA